MKWYLCFDFTFLSKKFSPPIVQHIPESCIIHTHHQVASQSEIKVYWKSVMYSMYCSVYFRVYEHTHEHGLDWYIFSVGKFGLLFTFNHVSKSVKILSFHEPLQIILIFSRVWIRLKSMHLLLFKKCNRSVYLHWILMQSSRCISVHWICLTRITKVNTQLLTCNCDISAGSF